MASKRHLLGLVFGALIVIFPLIIPASAIDCSDGYFGVDCGGICHCNATDDICDKRTGHCPFGCADGWQGAICQDRVPAEANSAVSVIGVTMGVAVTIIIVAVAAIFCCFSKLQMIRTRNRLSREDQRAQRDSRVQEYFHNYNSPHRYDRRNPFRVIPFSQKLDSRHFNQQYGPPPKYPGNAVSIATRADILPPRSETPPPTYEESISTDAQRHEIATRRQSRETLISAACTENSSREIWTIT